MARRFPGPHLCLQVGGPVHPRAAPKAAQVTRTHTKWKPALHSLLHTPDSLSDVGEWSAGQCRRAGRPREAEDGEGLEAGAELLRCGGWEQPEEGEGGLEGRGAGLGVKGLPDSRSWASEGKEGPEVGRHRGTPAAVGLLKCDQGMGACMLISAASCS